MRERVHVNRTMKDLVADLRLITKEVNKVQTNVLLDIKNLILLLQKNKGYVCKHIPCAILKC